MLYDPKWEVKADPFSLESLIAWLEMQPGDKTYCYMDTGGCLLHQYLNAVGVGVGSMGGTVYSLSSDPETDITLPMPLRRVARTTPHTFGAALTRARAAFSAGK